jgi:hypothetical protein
LQPAGHLAQQDIARRVTQAVVDFLEVIEIDQQQRDRQLVAAGVGDRASDAIGKSVRFARPVSGSWSALRSSAPRCHKRWPT